MIALVIVAVIICVFTVIIFFIFINKIMNDRTFYEKQINSKLSERVTEIIG